MPSKISPAKQDAKMIPTVDIFAMACAAQRINGAYLKEAAYEHRQTADGYDEVVAIKRPNKEMVREWLAKGITEFVTDADRTDAEAVRGYWQLKLFNVLNDTANDYERSAVQAASADAIESRDHKSIGIIASLPAAYERGVLRDKRLEVRQEAAMGSRHFGRIGDAVAGEVKIVDCIYSQNWSCYYVTGKLNGNMILFTQREPVEVDRTFLLKGKVKKHRDDNVTQLNYVKIK